MLSTAPPIAFGFLDEPTGFIEANGSQLTLTQTNTLSSRNLDEESEDIVFAAPEIIFKNGTQILLEGGNTTFNDNGREVLQPEIALIATTSAGEIIFGRPFIQIMVVAEIDESGQFSFVEKTIVNRINTDIQTEGFSS